MSIVYSLIAENGQIRAEYPSDKSSFSEVSSELVSKIPRMNHKKTYTQSKYHFHYVSSGDYIYLCVADASYPMRICYAFLQDVETSNLRARNPKALRGILRDKMIFHNNSENDKMSKIHVQMEDIKGVMLENIEKVLHRGERLENLVEKTQLMSDNATDFGESSRRVKNTMWWHNVKLWIILIVLILGIIVAVTLVVVANTRGSVVTKTDAPQTQD